MGRNFKSRKVSVGKAGRSEGGHHATRLWEEIRFELGQSSVGAILVASSDKGVVAILVGEDADHLVDDLQRRFPEAHLVSGDRDDRKLVARVVALVENPAVELNLELDIRGTAFQKRVWRAVREIPAGQTASYSEVARKIGAPKAMRAVGSACANCHLSLVIPCHRVTRQNGSCRRGDRTGDHRRRSLIEREEKRGVERRFRP